MKNKLIKATLIALAIFSLHITNSVFAAAGDLDLSFSSDGFALNQLGDGDDRVAAMAVQSDGKIVVAGTSGVNANSQFVLARYTLNGSLDTTFGASGKMQTRNIAHLVAKSVVIQADGKILVGGSTFNTSGPDFFVIARYKTSGFLDTTFGNGGIVTTPIGNVDCKGGSIAVLASGNLVLAGSFGTASNQDIVVVQYKPDGTIAGDFGNNGFVFTNIGLVDESVASIAIQSNGRIVVASSSDSGSHFFAVVRYLANGNLDTSFGSGGIVITVFGVGDVYASDVKIQTNGDILVAGSSRIFVSPGFTNDIVVVKYQTNGSLDTSFGNNGIVTETAFNVGFIRSMDVALSIQTDGRIVAASTTTRSVGLIRDFLIIRFNGNGSLDTDFDSDGKVTTSFSTDSAAVIATAIQSDGNIVAAGIASDNFAVARYKPSGSLDTTFNNDGIVTTNNFSSNVQLEATALQSDGKIVAAGSVFDGVRSTFVVFRYNTNGSLDASFSSNGITATGFGTSTDNSFGRAVAIQSDGKIVVVGEVDNGTNLEIAIAKYNTNGNLDLSFDTDGKVTSSLGASISPKVFSAAMQANGNIFVTGYALNGAGNVDFLLAKYKTTGTLDSTFNSDGIVTTPIGTRNDIASAITIQADGRIVVVGSSENSFPDSTNRFAVVRYNTNGTLDINFNGNGITTTQISDNCGAESVAIDAEGRIVVAGRTSSLTNLATLARYNSNGSLDTSFDSDGIVTTDLGLGPEVAAAVAIQADGKIVAGGTSFFRSGEAFNFTVFRYNANGSLDASSIAENNLNLFGTGGIVSTNFIQQSSDFILAIAIQPDGKIVAVGSSDGQAAIARYQGSLAPTAATAAINGRVSTASGRGIRNVSILLTDTTTGETKYTRTNPFGYYRFQDLEVGRSYILNLQSKRFTFAEPTRVITLN
jgi:uncharacterized delta-60 repeat protein